jgi:LPXTG-motif cell wall-anchored protein
MIGTQAALCQNGVFDLVEADSKNTPLTQTNYLRNFSCSSDISRGVTVMEFDRSFSEVGDSVVDFSSPYYLVAALGDSPNFEQHISKAYTYVPTMTTSTKSPTIAAPPTSSPTEPPTLAQTSAPTIKQTKTSLFGANSPIKADVETISSSSVKFTVTCPTKNWCAIGMNKKEAKMAGMEAIICANGLVDVYEATGHSTPKLAPQDYVISSCLQNSTTTVMTFTRPLTLKSDLANPNTVNLSSSDSNYFLAAQGLGAGLSFGHSAHYSVFGSIYNAESNNNTGEKGSSAGTIAGIVVPLLLVALLGGAYYYRKQKQKRQDNTSTAVVASTNNAPIQL